MLKKQPNILLIFVDNQPAKLLGCSGNEEIHTPNLDRLAENGVRFSDEYCPTAMFSACRASVLTGLMPSQHGVHTWLNDNMMAEWPKDCNTLDELPTLSALLADAGYYTALLWNYHLGIADRPQNVFNGCIILQVGLYHSF